MRNFAAILLVFTAGFIIMVLEIIGARFLAKDFGNSLYVWVSQIGVVLVALALGYYLGGMLADKWRGVRWLAAPLWATGLMLWTLPAFTPWLLERIVMRHPLEKPIPALWQRLDPVLGSTLIFLVPCLVLAALSPYMIRRTTESLALVGRLSGRIIAASTLGSIAGVFIAGFILMDKWGFSAIFRLMGVLTVMLGVLCLWMDRWLWAEPKPAAAVQTAEKL